MRDLLLNHNLAKSTPGDGVQQVARAQTISTLRFLDAARNRIVLQFLQRTNLIGIGNAVIELNNADLTNADLSGANLSGIYLKNAILTGARLDGANLSKATMYGAELGNSDLSNANLSNTILSGAFLHNTIASHATLTGARLNGASLTGAKLNDAFLSGADLTGADVSGTDLSGTDLSDADLSGTNLTQPQLDTVSSCTKALIGTSLACHHNVKITLTYWYTESDAEKGIILNTLIPQFEKTYPDIHINAVQKNFFQTRAEFVNDVQNNDAPDVLRSDVGWVEQFAAQGYLLNIDSYISQEDLSDYKKAPTGSMPLNYNYYNGDYYGLPQVTDFLALVYNKKELESAGISSPPATMAEFEADAVKVAQSEPGTYGFETDGSGYNVLPFLLAFGGGILGQHDEPLVNDPGSAAGLNFLLKLQNTDKVMPTIADVLDGRVNIVNDFMSGKTAMIFDGPYDVSQILTASGSRFNGHPGNLGIAGIPTCPAKTPTCYTGQTGSPLGGQSYVIYAGTAHPYEAAKFISFMSSTTSQAEIAQENHTLPTRGSAYQGRVISDPFILKFLPLARNAVGRPAIPQAGNFFDALDPYIANALNGVQSPLAALNAVADAWKQLLAGS
jgi:arabinogalactan oligomer/maltooligosaccharide transport system substrate-binding protein